MGRGRHISLTRFQTHHEQTDIPAARAHLPWLASHRFFHAWVRDRVRDRVRIRFRTRVTVTVRVRARVRVRGRVRVRVRVRVRASGYRGTR